MTSKERIEAKWEFTKVDPDRLPEEWYSQIEVYGHWAKKLAIQKGVAARLQATEEVEKAELKRIDAYYHLKMRSMHGKFKIKNPTDVTISKAILLQQKYKDQQKKMYALRRSIIDAEQLCNMIEAACRTLYQRKEMLQDQVRMLLSEIRAEPKALPGTRSELRQIEKQIAKKKSKV